MECTVACSPAPFAKRRSSPFPAHMSCQVDCTCGLRVTKLPKDSCAETEALSFQPIRTQAAIALKPTFYMVAHILHSLFGTGARGPADLRPADTTVLLPAGVHRKQSADGEVCGAHLRNGTLVGAVTMDCTPFPIETAGCFGGSFDLVIHRNQPGSSQRTSSKWDY
ncbi:hypothetical protein JZ751_009105 [Albula glossodonta]|uniref:Uncharacterized protein n=1 Tax=Albula glossodonta TaxID=121402 RepID=A0A8T2N144_9TELE|nr:hypothetical protein JZ751_009105 [Albula glossodonta]